MRGLQVRHVALSLVCSGPCRILCVRKMMVLALVLALLINENAHHHTNIQRAGKY